MTMRIAYLLPDLGIPFLGTKGAAVHARAITRALCDHGHDVTCYAARVGRGGPPPPGLTLRAVQVPPFVADLTEAVINETAASGVAPPPQA